MILILGYGNPLRSDDAVGQQIARALRFGRGDVEVLTAYQLTPELAEPISRARRVVFIDARVGETPGALFHELVSPQPGAGAFTHNVTPASLLGAANELYGAHPAGLLISVVGADFDYGAELSPLLSRALPGIADQVQAIIESTVQVYGCEEESDA